MNRGEERRRLREICDVLGSPPRGQGQVITLGGGECLGIPFSFKKKERAAALAFRDEIPGTGGASAAPSPARFAVKGGEPAAAPRRARRSPGRGSDSLRDRSFPHPSLTGRV